MVDAWIVTFHFSHYHHFQKHVEYLPDSTVVRDRSQKIWVWQKNTKNNWKCSESLRLLDEGSGDVHTTRSCIVFIEHCANHSMMNNDAKQRICINKKYYDCWSSSQPTQPTVSGNAGISSISEYLKYGTALYLSPKRQNYQWTCVFCTTSNSCKRNEHSQSIHRTNYCTIRW